MKDNRKIFNVISISSILGDILLLILGLYFAFNPETQASLMGYMFGLALLIVGIYNSIKYIINFSKNKLFITNLIYGVLSIIIGIFILFNPFSIANIISIMIGLWLIMSSLFNGALVWQLKKHKEEIWVLSLTITTLSLILGILVLINPFHSYLLLTAFVGILVSCYSAINILQQLLFRRRVNEIIKIFYE